MSIYGETKQRMKRSWKHADQIANHFFEIWQTYEPTHPGFANVCQTVAKAAMMMRASIESAQELLDHL